MKVFVFLLFVGFDWIYFDYCFLGYVEYSCDEW